MRRLAGKVQPVVALPIAFRLQLMPLNQVSRSQHRAAQDLPCKTAVHICYGYGIKANIDWKSSLGPEWRQYEAIFPALARSRIDQVSVECAGAKVPLDLLGLSNGKEVLLGSIDVASERVEAPEEVAATIEQASRFLPVERIYPCTNCGMAPMDRSLAISKLVALGVDQHRSGTPELRPHRVLLSLIDSPFGWGPDLRRSGPPSTAIFINKIRKL